MKRMGMTYLGLAVAASATLVSGAASAEVTVAGSTTGCFQATGPINCSPGGLGATYGGLSFIDGTFTGTTSDNFLGIGGALSNLGSLTLSALPFNYGSPAEQFKLRVNFTAPPTSPNGSNFVGDLMGSVSATLTGGVSVLFDNGGKTFTYNGGSFVLFVDNQSLQAGQTVTLSGRIVNTNTPAVPEPATWGLMILGFGMAGGAIRSRRARTNVSFA